MFDIKKKIMETLQFTGYKKYFEVYQIQIHFSRVEFK